MCDSIAAPLTITLRSMRARHDGAEVLLQILLENGEHKEQKTLVLTTEQYCELKPTRGLISEETYEKIEEASKLCEAVRTGEYLLSFGANSVQSLTRKLVQRGYQRDVALAAAQRLEGEGLIDEERDLRHEVEKCLRKLWGAKRIRTHLWSRGYASESMQSLDELLTQVDFEASCVALIKKHYGDLPEDREEQRRVVAFLSRYGYSISEIRSALKALKTE